MTDQNLKKTPLHALHLELGGKMVPFAGYEMPVQFKLGVLGEHNWTREKAGLFDVSHMGQAFLKTKESEHGTDDAHLAVADAMETLAPGELRKLKRGRMRYSVLLNDEGGAADDLMISRPLYDDYQGWLYLVVNGAVKDADYALMREKLGDRAELDVKDDLALMALQGPKAAAVIAKHAPDAAQAPFMSGAAAKIGDTQVYLSRCGYTGEDGFEISVHAGDAEKVARLLLDDPDVAPIGLGARDSLRLEAGLCLYGNDLDPTTSPIEADLKWIIGKRRREEGGFPGAERILGEMADGPGRVRVGIRPGTRAPARAGVEILSEAGEKIGVVTSGGFGPTADGPVAMGYVAPAFAEPGTKLTLLIRGKETPAEIAATPFVPHRYYRG